MKSNKIPYFFLGLAAVFAIAALALLIYRPGSEQPTPAPASEKNDSVTEEKSDPDPIKGLDEPVPEQTPEEILEKLGAGIATVDPAELLERIGEALEKGDLAAVSKLIGKDALDTETIAKLDALAKGGKLRLRKPGGVREIGELEMNRRSRWVIELEGREEGQDRIVFDLRKEQGKWSIERMLLLPAPGEGSVQNANVDPLGVADDFLQSVLRQDFETARNFVDVETVSEAKIAALCILFEEGDYRMRPEKPIRAMFRREDVAGFIANVETSDGSQPAQFGMNLRQPEGGEKWIVSEINLDDLIADYAKRFAGGDVYYSPLVENPAGGETLALYFEFDEDAMSPRTSRQLEIVAAMLRSDSAKKITLSGHTDALGSDDYNDKLSANRADTVRDFLAAAGVSPEQIVTVAKGASQPRRPNLTESGEDNPDGRRANRRTEIYLDF
ncbi:MAG: OmpA family protein [Akkermansiaceae bacterium]|nr:OmpA family protein [Akkermansiaceae bacterium]